MNLFDKPLSLSEAMHIDSIFSKDGYDADVLMLHQAMKYNDNPYQQSSNNDAKNSNTEMTENVDTSQNSNDVSKNSNDVSENSNDVSENSNDVSENGEKENKSVKKKSRKYIKLPNATIATHQHKYRERKTKKYNEPTERNRNTPARNGK